MLNLKKLLTKVLEKIKALNDDIVMYEYTATQNIAAGTIGTRGAQVQFFNPAPQGYYVRAITITSIDNSNVYLPMAFYNQSDNKFYINFYRTTTSAVSNATCKIRIMFTKTNRGGGTLLAVFSRLSAIFRSVRGWSYAELKETAYEDIDSIASFLRHFRDKREHLNEVRFWIYEQRNRNAFGDRKRRDSRISCGHKWSVNTATISSILKRKDIRPQIRLWRLAELGRELTTSRKGVMACA